MEIWNLWKEQGKDIYTDLWCIRCWVYGHTKDQCPLLTDYMQVGEPRLIRPGVSRESALFRPGSSRSMLWCDDFRAASLHDTNHCPLLGAYVPKLKQKWCRFCRWVGHDEENCRTYDLMMDRGNLYPVQSDPASPRLATHFGGSLDRGKGGWGGSTS